MIDGEMQANVALDEEARAPYGFSKLKGAANVLIFPNLDAGNAAYKLLQVMAAGKPVIASPVGANRQVVQHGVNGFLAESAEEWAEALRKLADPALRQRMGAEARKTVEEQYATSIVTPRLAEILRKVAEFDTQR